MGKRIERSHNRCMERQQTSAQGALRVLPERQGAGAAVLDTPGDDDLVSEVRELRTALARQKRTFDLAMSASQMGTWRYTIADNICLYDENAQALYGLTEAPFLHDEDGVKAKFHPDDPETMWSQVAKALDPAGRRGPYPPAP
jgi:hypothetical protein